MKKFVLILCMLSLTGCVAIESFLMTYDTNEYRIITEIRADAQGYKEECANELLSNSNVVAMANKTRLFMLYSQHLPHNEPVQKASVELNKIAQGLKDQYSKGTKVSTAFCKIKFETLERNAESLQKVIGDKPR